MLSTCRKLFRSNLDYNALKAFNAFKALKGFNVLDAHKNKAPQKLAGLYFYFLANSLIFSRASNGVYFVLGSLLKVIFTVSLLAT